MKGAIRGEQVGAEEDIDRNRPFGVDEPTGSPWVLLDEMKSVCWPDRRVHAAAIGGSSHPFIYGTNILTLGLPLSKLAIKIHKMCFEHLELN